MILIDDWQKAADCDKALTAIRKKWRPFGFKFNRNEFESWVNISMLRAGDALLTLQKDAFIIPVEEGNLGVKSAWEITKSGREQSGYGYRWKIAGGLLKYAAVVAILIISIVKWKPIAAFLGSKIYR